MSNYKNIISLDAKHSISCSDEKHSLCKLHNAIREFDARLGSILSSGRMNMSIYIIRQMLYEELDHSGNGSIFEPDLKML